MFKTHIPPKTRKELCINQETFEGLTITGMSFLYTITKYDLYMYMDIHFTVLSFCELGPKLLNCGHYLLTEVLFSRPFGAIFLSSVIEVDNPTVNEYLENVATLHVKQHLAIEHKTT